MIVIICSQKGGGGKSTLATNLAVYLARKGHDVALVDADRQGTAANWSSDREGIADLKSIQSIQKYDNLKGTLQDLSKRYEIVVVDVAGHDSKEMRTALLVADLALIPTQCSQPDLDTLQAMEAIIDSAKDLNEGLKVHVVFSRVPTNPSVTELAEAKEYLSDLNLPLLETHLCERKVYRDAMKQGRGVLELGPNKAGDEITKLAQEINL